MPGTGVRPRHVDGDRLRAVVPLLLGERDGRADLGDPEVGHVRPPFVFGASPRELRILAAV